LTHGVSPFSDDFLELYNPDSLPVAVSAFTLTDQPESYPGQFVLRPLSFIGGNGFYEFSADGNAGSGPNHLNFKLADEIRNRLAGLGVVLEDRPDGTAWRIGGRHPASIKRRPGPADGDELAQRRYGERGPPGPGSPATRRASSRSSTRLRP